ncbi:3-methyl-2-oxobutanoate hydroxymethyltransferase [Paraliobacillus sp. PM-2]|uniref:3-methyl-2-oxobutanoate hydroxymethyltransferase n=1 Tax=Paraliobacillus sp. PM-2 TaxID=1462524 RepID=UPI00061C0CBE|nr:3-methyl-2-oxobutanoate hydroxymethyltransferase [Paraliobacillus sp. PM-2]CQR46671.1 3-methyl-2-oxobutanoate hydroxymethyltransferase [Paraliobacillus sp. PM-2]
MKNRITLQQMKDNNDKITMITAYDYPSAKMAEKADVDMILVGDSLGMVVLGYDSTIQVTVDDMIHHGKAVTRGASNTFVVVDMPFMSYHISVEESMKNARRIFQETNAQAVKVEGATPETLELISKLTHAGVPVVAHIGLTPQSVNVLGGFRVQGKDKESVERLIQDAKALEASGAIGIVLECIPKEVASRITQQLNIPTIGIGAGSHCDGQVLVFHDILQYGVDRLPKFVKTYDNLNENIPTAISQYISEVKQATFPNDAQSYFLSPEMRQALGMEEF